MSRKTPSSYVDIAGRQYYSWTVLYRVASRYKNIYYMCRCVCGFEAQVSKKQLDYGRSKSCGCQKNFRNWDRTRKDMFKRFSEEDDKYIRAWYPINGTKDLCKFLGRTREAIVFRARKLGVRTERWCSRRHDEWRDYETKILREHYPSGGTEACLKLLPKRTKDAIWTRATKLGIRRELDNERKKAA